MSRRCRDKRKVGRLSHLLSTSTGIEEYRRSPQPRLPRLPLLPEVGDDVRRDCDPWPRPQLLPREDVAAVGRSGPLLQLPLLLPSCTRSERKKCRRSQNSGSHSRSSCRSSNSLKGLDFEFKHDSSDLTSQLQFRVAVNSLEIYLFPFV